MYQWDKRYYLLHKRDLYLSYEDFLQQLPPASFKFLSNSDNTLPPVQWKAKKKKEWINPRMNPQTKKWTKKEKEMKTITDYKELAQVLHASWNKTQYVLSSSKQRSKDLFHELIKNKTQEKYTILAENITWWVGKNLYIASQSTKPVIMIWWYNFYLEALAKKFDFSTIYLYHIYGDMKKQIIYDILYYGEQ